MQGLKMNDQSLQLFGKLLPLTGRGVVVITLNPFRNVLSDQRLGMGGLNYGHYAYFGSKIWIPEAALPMWLKHTRTYPSE